MSTTDATLTSDPAPASGIVTVPIRTNGVETWTISQVSVEMPGAPAGATCTLRKNSYLVTALIATGDAATGDPPLTLLPSDQATVTWIGATPGSIGRVYLIYDNGRQ
jgi:hypothetical protein